MKKVLLGFIALCITITVFSQVKRIELQSGGTAKTQMLSSSISGFNATFSFSAIEAEDIVTENGTFSELKMDGSFPTGAEGSPALPMIPKFIGVPVGATPTLVINSYTTTEFDLNDYAISTVYPKQLPIRKDIDPSDAEMSLDLAVYSSNTFSDRPIARIETLGTLRGINLGKILINPVSYNPTTNKLIVYNDINITVSYAGADYTATTDLFRNTYSPAFEVIYRELVNRSVYDDYDDLYHTNVRMLVITDPDYLTTLAPWLTWKLQKGYAVDVFTTTTTGTTAAAIKTFIQTKYNASVTSGNAYTYLVLVGDSGDIPASGTYSESDLTGVVSDLYYASTDGDNFPEMYHSRISVESTTQLTNYINKVLTYEKYTMADPTYLNNTVLVAGWDATWTNKAGKPAINYATNNYFNATNTTYGGFGSGVISWVVSTSSTAGYSGTNHGCYQYANSGAGFVNYTAHGDNQMWYQPQMTTAQVASMTNADKYFIGVGNCCLTGNFGNTSTTYSPGSSIGTNACFAETMIRVPNAGAVNYIGCAPYSYWYEDLYWAVGSCNFAFTTTAATPTVAGSTVGVYDAMFNDANWNSVSSLNFIGNLAVTAADESSYTTSVTPQYYWRYYHTFGDGSVMPYVTVPEVNNITHASTIDPAATTFVVNAQPGSYAALSGNGVLYGVGVVDAGGSGTISITTALPSTGTLDLVITRQQYQPYITTVSIITSAPPIADFSGTPTVIQEGQSVTFTDASQNPGSWSWNFGDSQTSSLQNPVHTYTTAGTYTVSLAVTNGLGSNTETKLDYITVNPNTNPPTADFVADVTTVSLGGTVNFTDLSINNPTSWAWSFEGGTPISSTSQNPSVVYNTVGTYQVVLTATNTHGSGVETKLAYIIVNAPSYCDANAETEDEYISNVTFNTINNTTTWSTAGYGDYTALSTSIVQGSSYPISLTNAINYKFDQFIVWIDYNLDGDFEDTGEQVYFGAQTGTSTENPYTWTGSVTVPATTVIGPTRMRVRLNYNSTTYNGNSTPCGESDYGEVEDYTVIISAPLALPVSNFTADQTSGCGSLNVQFTDNTTNTPTSWLWNFGDSQTSTSQNPSHTYTAAGNYTVSLTATNSAGSDIETKTNYVVVNALPTLVTVAGGGTQCGGSMVLNATNGGSGTIYWQGTTSGGTSTTTASSSQTVSTSGTYYFRARSAEGCWGPQGSATVTINSIPTDVAVSGGGTFCGGTATLTATGGTGGTIYWQNTTNNGTSTATASASQTVSSTGTYYFRSQSAAGCWGNQGSATVTINALPTAVSVSGGGTQCGGSMILTATNGGSGTIYWQGTTSGGTSTTTASSSQTVSTSGTYYFRARSAEGCWGPEGSATVTINSIPADVAVSGGGSFCGGTATLTATGGTGGTIYWQNTTSNGISTATASASQTVSSTGTYYFRSQSAQGCWGNQGSATVTINALPTAVSVSGGGTQCGGSMILTATNGGSGTIYWQGTTSGGTSTTTASSSQTVSTSGTYYFRARSAEGCWGPEGSATVTINSIPADVAVSGGGSFCGGTATLTATGGTGGTIYWQNTTSNGISTATASASQTVSSTGTYYFRSQSAQGCWGNQGLVVVAINPVVEISMSSTDESAPGANDGTATVTVNSGTPNYDFIWNVAGSSATLSGLTGDTYCVTVSDANGCEDYACVTVNTLGAPPVADFEADVTQGCDNLTVNFTDLSANNPTSWEWNFGDGNNSNLQNPTNVYNAPGVYTVTLTVTNANGSNDVSFADMIIVGQTPSLIMSMTQESLSEINGTASVAVTGGLEPYAYEWTGGYITSEITGLEADTYCVTVTEDNGCSATDCIIVTQEEPLTPPVADFEADETMGCETLTVQFTDLSTNNPTSWAWNFGDGSSPSAEANPIHTYTAAGLFTVTLTVTNEDGSDVIEIADMIFVGTNPEVSVDVVHASGEFVADGSASVVITGGTAPFDILWSNDETETSISDLLPSNYSVMVVDAAGCIVTEPFTVSWTNSVDNATISMSIFPNPASDFVTVAIEGIVAESITLTNALGQVLVIINPETDITNIQLGNAEPGVYFIKVVADGKEFSNKIVVKK